MSAPSVESAAPVVGPREDTVGIVGLGRMGLAIAGRLRAEGVPVVGYNRTAERAASLRDIGGVGVDSPADVAARSHLLLCIVTGPSDVREVLLGPGGVRDQARPGLIVVDMSTIDPDTSRSVARELARGGADMLDAPLAGSVHDAARGTLGILVGGNAAVLERARPILSTVGRHVFHFGGHGAGCVAKLALNLMLGAMVQSLAESLCLLEAEGLSAPLFLSAVAASGLSSPLFERAGDRAIRADFAPRFAIEHLHKDLRLLQDESARHHLEMPLARVLERLVGERQEAFQGRDYSVLIHAQRQAAPGNDGGRTPERRPKRRRL